MSCWLVTGGAGFIGSNFVRRVARRTDELIVVLDALTYAGNLDNISDVLSTSRVRFVRGDICDAGLLDSLFAEHDFGRVVHFAAESHVDRSIVGPGAFLRTNVDGTFQLLEATRRHWPSTEGRRFLHVSTDEVFGDLASDAPSFTELSSYRPSSPYAASKAAADHLVRAWQRTFDTPVIISNCSNNYGPWQFPEKLIPLMILNALEERPLPVYGDGMQRRDWLHVEDHCEALLLMLQRGTVGETYVVGGGDERPNMAIVESVCVTVDAVLGREAGTTRKLVRHVTDRPGHDRRYSVDSSKLRAALGWRPTQTIETALPTLVAWYIANKTWADNVRSGEYRRFYDLHYAEPGGTVGRTAAASST